MIFEIGEHSDIPPIPKNFPTCGNYFYPENGDAQQKLNEIDFSDQIPNVKYNVERDVDNENNEVDSIHSSYWSSNHSDRTNYAIRYTYSSALIYGTMFLSIARLV